MMVAKGGKPTPPGSRGTSPARDANNKTTKFSPSRSRVFGTSPKRAVPNNSPEKRILRSRGNSPAKTENGIRSRGNSPAKVENGIKPPSSRGSETGSIERLDESSHSNRIITSYNQAEDNINVVVRVRPLSKKEIQAGDAFATQFPGSGQILIDGVPNGGSAQKSKLFSYNVVFEPAATQEDVLQYSGIKRLLEMAVEGFRCTAFCYGQTGSGKTHTLTGPPGLFDKKRVQYSDSHGLVFRSFMYLFKLLEQQPDVHFILKASFLEIYNEKVIDLLNPGSSRKPLAVRWSKKARGFFVENLFTVDCEELDDLTAVLEEGMRNRSVGSHNMNEYSSRSHTILTVQITSEQAAERGVFLSRSGKINFVDLAGSEMTKKTQSEGKTLEEANNINKSLMVLGYCIASLSDNKRKNNHIPYRDSQLTKLLADSLAGNGVTLMIACISPARSNLTETINTLRYAARAKKIRTKPIVLMDPREALILSLKREVGVLQSENEHLRSALHLQAAPSDLLPEKRIIATPPHVDLDKLAELEGPQLVDLVRLYVTENEALRRENMEMFVSREMLLRDQELVCRENERLLKKLEDVNSVCCRSPIVMDKTDLNRSAIDLDLSSTNIWTNPDQLSASTRSLLPEVIQKELSKRMIGNGLNNISDGGHRRHNSLEDLRSSTRGLMPIRVKSSESANNEFRLKEIQDLDRPASGRRFSMAKSPASRSGTITTPVLPDRLEFSGRSKPNSSGITSPLSPMNGSTGSPSESNTQEGQHTPLLERRNSQDVNGLRRSNSKRKSLFGSAISLVDEVNGN